ncbi:MAG: hypothetical protein GY928_14740 [Colwellia sp.]|nr:hypothetical protein [Colwellia sp.]
MNNVKEQLEKRGLSFRDYKMNLNFAYMMATVSENYIMQPEDLLRRGTCYRLESKQQFQNIKKHTGNLLKRAENLPDDQDEAFYNAVSFIKAIADEAGLKDLTKEDGIKIVSYIKNNF